MLLKAFDEIIECKKVIKGPDYIDAIDGKGNVIVKFSGIRDFSGFEIEGGEWSMPEVSQADRTEAQTLYTALMTDTLIPEV